MPCFVTVTYALDAHQHPLWGTHMLMFPCTGTAHQAAKGAEGVMDNEVFIFISELQAPQADGAK